MGGGGGAQVKMLGKFTFNKLTCSASFAFNSCNKIKCTLPPVFFRYDQHQGFSVSEVCLLGNNHPWLLLENQFLKKKDLSKINATERYESYMVVSIHFYHLKSNLSFKHSFHF